MEDAPKMRNWNERIDNFITKHRLKLRRNEDLTTFNILTSKDFKIKRVQFICNECNFIWRVTFGNLNHKKGCPKCSNSQFRHHNNETIDEHLKLYNGKVIRVGEYVSFNQKIKLQCLTCKKDWNALISTYIRKNSQSTGCPFCAGNLPISNKLVDKKLEETNRMIKRLEPIITCRVSIKWECLTCHYIWKSSPDNVINQNKGCAKCAGNANHTNETVDNIIKDRYIKRLSDISEKHQERYINGTAIYTWECLKCEVIWKAPLTNVLRKKNASGCPNCKHKRQAYVGELLKKHNTDYIIKYQYPIYVGTQKRIIDFALIKDNFIALIEYDGQQHFMPVDWGYYTKEEAEQNLIKQKIRDEQVRQYAKDNNIPFLSLPYTMSNKQLSEAILQFIKPNHAIAQVS